MVLICTRPIVVFILTIQYWLIVFLEIKRKSYLLNCLLQISSLRQAMLLNMDMKMANRCKLCIALIGQAEFLDIEIDIIIGNIFKTRQKHSCNQSKCLKNDQF